MNNVMDIDNVEIIINKMNALFRDELFAFDSFKKIDLNSCYENDLLCSIKSSIEDSFFSINNLQKDNISFIESKKGAYIDAALKSKKELGDI